MEIVNTSKRILFMLLLLIGFISSVFLYMGHFHHKFVLDVIVKEEQKVASRIYLNTFKHITSKYEAIANNLLMNQQIVTAFEKEDRAELLKITKPIYEKLLSENPYLEIMHFHTKDTKSFLRLHKPDKYGDDLSAIRHMINSVNKTKVEQIGIEVGRYGIHHRIALPVFSKDGKYLGAFEFGIDISYLFNLFEKEYEFRTILLLSKDIFKIVYEDNTKYKQFSQEYYVVQPGNRSTGICDSLTTSILKKNYIMTYTDRVDYLIFKVTDLSSVEGSHIGKFLFVKDMNFYTHKIGFIRNITIGAALFLMLLSLYFLRRIFSNYANIVHKYQDKLEVKNRTLTKLSNTDHLTKLSNRKYIDTVLKKELKRAHRYNHPLSVILFDIDNFKSVNDNYGHNVGDKVLRGISKSVSGSIRESDYVGRWGGEEFIIISTETALDTAMILAEKVRMKIEQLEFEELRGITCSIGVAEYDNSQSYEDLIHCADTALYKAKKSGKNRVVAHKN